MRSQSWSSRVLRLLSRRAARPSPRPVRVHLRVEELERRETPAVFTVTSALDNLNTVNPTTTPLSAQGDLTLRQAIIDANATPGTNTINFAIPPPTTAGGVNLTQVINLLAPLPTLSNPTILDGTSQAGWDGAPVIDLNLNFNTGLAVNELATSANGCVIQGLAFTPSSLVDNNDTGLALYSSNNGVYGDTFFGLETGLSVSGGASNNTIGGPTATQGNFFDDDNGAMFVGGIGTSNNVVQGNAIVGGGAGVGIVVGAVANTIGGTTVGAGNSMTGVTNGVILESLASVSGNILTTTSDVVQGNTIVTTNNGFGITTETNGNTIGGTGPGAGNTIVGPGNVGIEADGNTNSIQGNRVTGFTTGIVTAANNTIGGTAAGAGNVIGGNTVGIDIQGTGNTLQGNQIGIDSGVAVPNGTGVLLEFTASKNLIGGTATGAGNTIADNTGYGVDASAGLSSTAVGNTIEGNSIFNNTLGGINPDTVVAPSAPVLKTNTAVTQHGKNISQVTGTIAGTPNTTYRVELFSNPTSEAQGQTFLGFINVTTNGSGKASFTFNASAVEPDVTATATDPGGNTSAFSFAVADPPAGSGGGRPHQNNPASREPQRPELGHSL